MCKSYYIILRSLAREAIRCLREEEKLAPSLEYHHRFCAYTKTANFKLEEKPVTEKKEGGKAEKQPQQQKGAQQPKK